MKEVSSNGPIFAPNGVDITTVAPTGMLERGFS